MKSEDILLGIDAGGTHTDAVAVQGGRLVARAKVATDHGDLPSTVDRALAALAADGGAGLLAGASRATIGTTLLVNAAVQDRLDPVGLALSAGPGLSPLRFAMGDRVCVVPGGLDHRGAEVAPLDVAPLSRAAASWREDGVRAVACVSKFSPRNPAHEKAMGAAVSAAMPGARPTLGHALGGELNFPRRIASAWYNSAARRLHESFLDALERVFAARGLGVPLFLLRADGGAVPLGASRAFPVRSILSGPAASVMGVMALDPDAEGSPCSLLVDMGGTTTDLALMLSGSPVLDRDGMTLGGRRTLVRSLATRSIGVGGDSLIRAGSGPEGPFASVGPLRKGPAMAFGGGEATLLDALNVLNASPETAMDATAGDAAASEAGIAALAARAGTDRKRLALLAWKDALARVSEAVSALVSDVNAKPIYTLRELKGHVDASPRDVRLVGGPTHCVRRRLEAGMGRPVAAVPEADVANAVGAALTRPSATLEVYAETGGRTFAAPALDVSERLPRGATLAYVRERALALLGESMERSGAGGCPLEVSQEELFATLSDSGYGSRDMRVTCQAVPGILTAVSR